MNSKKNGFLQIFWELLIMLLFTAVMTGFIERIFGLYWGMHDTTFPAVIVDAVYAAIYIRNASRI